VSGPLGAADAVGVAWADVRFRGDKAPKDVANILDDASDEGDAKMADTGDKWGETLDEHLKKSTKNTGRDVARGISAGIEREGFEISRATLRFDRNGNATSTWVSYVAKDLEKVIKDSGSSGGFNKVGEALGSAIGAGFNVSGKSPLIAFLIPVIGLIVEAVGAAIEAVAALTSLLVPVPNILFALGLQAGVLLLAFQGMGDAIKNAFAAKDAEELDKALKGLAPAAATFVRELLPLRDVFKNLKNEAQQGFFSGLTDLGEIIGPDTALIKTLNSQVGPLAETLGSLATTVLRFFNDPVFIQFLNTVVPSTIDWLRQLGPAIVQLLTGLSEFGTAVTPFVNWFGQVFNQAIFDLGVWLDDLAHNTVFLKWLDEVKGDLSDVWDLLTQAGELIMAFVHSLNAAGEENGGFIAALTEQLKMLTDFFKSPLGEGALRALMSIAVVLSQILIGSLLTISVILVAIEGLRMAVVDLFHGIGGFLSSLGDKWDEFWAKVEWAWNTFIENITHGFASFRDSAIAVLTGFRDDVSNYFTSIRDNIIDSFNNTIERVRNFFGGLGGNIADAVGNLGGVLWNAGVNLIQGLINGALAMIGPLKSAFSWLMNNGVLSFLPHSPAKEGPLSGEGDPMIAGATIVQRIATGMEMEAPALQSASAVATSNVLLGTGAVQMNFYGATPTNAQAGGIGAAAGNSLATTLAQRNTRLAVRSLGSGI
jgi:hypothetical protein